MNTPPPPPPCLQLMSEATQLYLKRVLTELTTVAWQRRGGLSGDILRGGRALAEAVMVVVPAGFGHVTAVGRGRLPVFFLFSFFLILRFLTPSQLETRFGDKITWN